MNPVEKRKLRLFHKKHLHPELSTLKQKKKYLQNEEKRRKQLIKDVFAELTIMRREMIRQGYTLWQRLPWLKNIRL